MTLHASSAVTGTAKVSDLIRRSTLPRTLSLGLLSLAVICTGMMTTTLGRSQEAPPTEEQRFVAGLLQRGLLELAEQVCERQLQSDETQRDVWTREMLRILAERAMESEDEQQSAAFWQRAEQLGLNFVREHEDHPRAITVEIQLALNQLARGENLRIQAEMRADASIEEALAALAEADRAFRNVDKKLQLLIGRAGTRRDGQLTRDDLFALQNKTVYDRARVAQQRGLCYEPKSADRAAAMGAAIDFLDAGLTRLDPNATLAYQMRIERAACYRELGDLANAATALATVLKLPVDDQLVPALRAEQLRLAIARRDATEVQRALSNQDPRLKSAVTWRLAKLEGAIFLWQANAQNSRIAQRWRNESLTTLTTIEREHGGYWARRANRILIRSATGSADVAVLQRRADEFYLRGQLDEAVLAYDKAAKAAAESGDAEGQFLAMYRAARVVEQQDNRTEFRRRLEAIISELPDQPSSDDAHLVLIRTLAADARKDNQQIDRYEAALKFHLQQWPDENTTDQVRTWYAMVLASRGKDEEAIQTYRAVRPDSATFAEALEGLRVVWLRRLHQHPEERSGAFQFLLSAVSRDTTADANAQQSQAAQRHAIWVGTQLSLLFAPEDLETWQPMLAQIWPEIDDTRLRADILPTHLAALAATGHVDQAESLVADLHGSQPLLTLGSQLIGLLRRGEESTEQGGVDFNSVSRLLGLIAEQARKDHSIDERVLQNWEAAAAEIHGDTKKAVQLYQKILADSPRDAGTRRRLAELLGKSQQKPQLEEAIRQWRIIAAGYAKGHDQWYNAKWEVARLYLELGNSAEAVKRIRYLQLTARPKEPWKSKFDALLKSATKE